VAHRLARSYCQSTHEQRNLGDCKPVGDGISEMRINVGPAYRLYFARRDKVVYLLLCGGDKSTQKQDIQRAKTMLKELGKESENHD